jgi:hypothetical protein
MIMNEDDRDQNSNEEFSSERNEDGSYNEARERALEKIARRSYEDESECLEIESQQE